MRCLGVALLAITGSLAFSTTVSADAVLFTGSGTGETVDGNSVTLSASALFSISGNILTITLSNTGDTSATGQDVPGNQLTGLFFSLPTGITLSTTPDGSATAPSLVQADQCDVPCGSSNVNVGGEFAFNTGSFGAHLGSFGISSAGYIGTNGNLNGSDLDSPPNPDGPNFSIIAPTGTYQFNPNGGLADVPLVDGTVIFTLTISGGTLLEEQISNVSFQYGTMLTEPYFAGGGGQKIPEPISLLLLAPGIALAMRRLRRAKPRTWAS